jgi:hypothetical protein
MVVGSIKLGVDGKVYLKTYPSSEDEMQAVGLAVFDSPARALECLPHWTQFSEETKRECCEKVRRMIQ